jgi:hypothetical protein
MVKSAWSFHRVPTAFSGSLSFFDLRARSMSSTAPLSNALEPEGLTTSMVQPPLPSKPTSRTTARVAVHMDALSTSPYFSRIPSPWASSFTMSKSSCSFLGFFPPSVPVLA